VYGKTQNETQPNKNLGGFRNDLAERAIASDMRATKPTANPEEKPINEETNRHVHGHLCFFEMAIHRGIDAHHGPLHNGPVLELDGHLLSVELLQKFDQLHRFASIVAVSV
jgi:hypothetical protein